MAAAEEAEMRTRHDLSIRQKITGIVLATCGVSILIACAIFAVYDRISFRRSLGNELATVAAITGSNTTAALAFGDPKSAEETLSSLSSQAHIVEACIYTPNGRVFATYIRPGSDLHFTPPALGTEGTAIRSGYMVLFHEIRLNGEQIGTIYLKSDLDEMESRATRFAETVLGVILVSFVTAFLLASRLQRVISEPIRDLARTASTISLGKNYSLRAVKRSEDDIGSLVDRFNEMLTKIQTREAALQFARDEMEMRVEERTIELQKEIAERKQTERTLEDRTSFLNSLIANSPVAIVGLDEDQAVQLCNPAFESLFRYRLQDILGQRLSDLLAAPEISSEVAVSRKRLVQGKTTHIVTRRKRSDGTLVDVDGFSVPIFVDGKVTGAVVLYQDITERKRSEEALLKAKEDAESASRAKSEFLANMSHEIRTPMNGIIGMTELTLDTDLTAEQHEYLRMVKTSADSLLVLINDILDFSKIEAGKLELEMIDFLLTESLGETLKLMALRAHQKGLELAWRVAPEVPDRLKGDVGRLRQVLINLLGNAIKFTERGEVVLEVEKEAEDANGVLLHFRVRDTGIGIPKEKQQLVFEAFTQADSSATRKYGGTGLGLAITSRLVELIGGKIWVESEPGKGSTFHFTGHFGFAEDIGQVAPPANAEIAQGFPILVADDNETNRVILLEMLSAWGLRPEPAEGGKTALQKLARAHEQGRRFRLVIADMQMPDMDGSALSEEIRKSPDFGHVPILLLSSSPQQAEASGNHKLAMIRYLTKPVQPSELLDAIFGALSNPSDILNPSAATQDLPPERMRGMTVLLAEDNAVNRKLATTLLEKRGHTVVVAENGQEALDALERENIDLVLMDVQMPVMDGLKAMRAIRSKEQNTGAHLPIIALTAHAMKGDKERCIGAGADEYVTKPLRLAELLAAIYRLRTGIVGVPAHTPAAPGGVTSGALDLIEALERVEGDRELLEEIARIFADECPGNIAAIRQALEAGDTHQLELLAHTIKGASANFGASGVTEAALKLENCARDGNLETAGRCTTDLEREIARLLPELESLCRKVAP